MLKFNNLIWTIFFKTVKPLTDNAGIVIILFSIFFGIGFSFITYLYRKENVRYLGLLDGLYLTSVFYMLRQLPLIHPRIHQALSTVSSIIKASSAYSANFQKAAGITVKKTSDIVYYLYNLSPEKLQDWFKVQPELLYRKLYTAFEHSRYLFGYVDKKVVWTTDFIYFIPFVLLLLVMVKQSYQEIDRIHTKDAIWLVFHMVLYFAIWLWVFLSGPRGCVLAFNVLYATHILMNYMLSKNNYFKKQN